MVCVRFTHVRRYTHAMISLIRGTCWRCEYQATVGIGPEDGTRLAVEWAPANCPACGLVSVSVAGLDGKPPVCHECGAMVELYSPSGGMPDPRQGRVCPECGERTLAFSPAES